MGGPEEMPEPIAAAVTHVMRRAGTLTRDEHNPEADYRYASIDGFLAAVGPLCARTGLIILQDERAARLVDNPIGNAGQTWLWVTFAFTLAHKSGALWGPVTRSVMVPADGAQAFGAAQSYALKQFLRSLFQIPTADGEDADRRAGEVRTAADDRPIQLFGTVRRGRRDKPADAAAAVSEAR